MGTKTLEPYFYNDYVMDGKYDLPLIAHQEISLHDLKLIRFSSIVKDEKSDLDATVHFFEFDDRFDEVWRNPQCYLSEIKQYKQVLSPDFSMYTTMSLALQIFNTFRSRWCGAFWQMNGLVVIPTVSWSDEWSYEFCFDGIEQGTIVAVSTIGCADSKRLFLGGFAKMCEKIKPKKVICYAKPFDEMRNMADLIIVPYQQNKRIVIAQKEEC
jgi:hypothetical protein